MSETAQIRNFAEILLQCLNSDILQTKLPDGSPLAVFNEILREQIRNKMNNNESIGNSKKQNDNLFKVVGTIGSTPQPLSNRRDYRASNVVEKGKRNSDKVSRKERIKKEKEQSSKNAVAESFFESYEDDTLKSSLVPTFSSEGKCAALKTLIDDKKISCFILKDNNSTEERIAVMKAIEKQLAGISDSTGLLFLNCRKSTKINNESSINDLNNEKDKPVSKEIKRIERRINKNIKDRLLLEEKNNRIRQNRNLFRKVIKLNKKKRLVIELRRRKVANVGTQISKKTTLTKCSHRCKVRNSSKHSTCVNQANINNITNNFLQMSRKIVATQTSLSESFKRFIHKKRRKSYPQKSTNRSNSSHTNFESKSNLSKSETIENKTSIRDTYNQSPFSSLDEEYPRSQTSRNRGYIKKSHTRKKTSQYTSSGENTTCRNDCLVDEYPKPSNEFQPSTYENSSEIVYSPSTIEEFHRFTIRRKPQRRQYSKTRTSEG